MQIQTYSKYATVKIMTSAPALATVCVIKKQITFHAHVSQPAVCLVCSPIWYVPQESN